MLKKIVVRKSGVKLVFEVELPIVGLKTVEEELKPVNGVVVFKEPVQIRAIEYEIVENKISAIILHVGEYVRREKTVEKPCEIEVPEFARGGRVEKIAEAYCKTKSHADAAALLGISKVVVRDVVNALKMLSEGKVVFKEFDGKRLYAMVEYKGSRYYVSIDKDVAYAKSENIAKKYGWMKDLERKYLESKYVVSEKDMKTLSKVKKFFKEESKLKTVQ